jgi:hypothetical protein
MVFRYFNQKNVTSSCNLTPQTVTIFVPKIPPACYAVELGVIALIKLFAHGIIFQTKNQIRGGNGRA